MDYEKIRNDFNLTSFDIGRRKFLIKSSMVVGASSILLLPPSLRAASSIFQNENVLLILSNSIGFNGERKDYVTENYHLGDGYRMYNTGLMRFNASDCLSPFGGGGTNPYAYCLGDPINMIDPSGHMSVEAGVGIGLGILGLIISIATLGTGIKAGVALIGVGASLSSTVSAGLSITSSVLGVTSAATGIASTSMQESNPEVASKLALASLGLGVSSAVTGIASAASSVSARTYNLRSRLGRIKHTGLSGRGAPKAAAQQMASNHIPLSDLPYPIQAKIYENLSLNDLQKLSQTSKSNYLATHETINNRMQSILAKEDGLMSEFMRKMTIATEGGNTAEGAQGMAELTANIEEVNKIFIAKTAKERNMSNIFNIR